MISGEYSILLDAEALSELAASGRRMAAWEVVARRTDSLLYVSALTFAETFNGTTGDAHLYRVRKALNVKDVTSEIGVRAGHLRAAAAATRRKARDLTVDAVVAATALTLPAPVIVLTSDLADLRLLLQGTSVKVEALANI
ncbi:MAG: PIN domain-containing protein [Promicromonosporaceae bacterium]|nr:PIN domain-containing protein [Promicromonosporaceae bacterium]